MYTPDFLPELRRLFWQILPEPSTGQDRAADRLCAYGHPLPGVPPGQTQAWVLITAPANMGELGGRCRRGKKSMHVNRVGNLFSISEEGFCREGNEKLYTCISHPPSWAVS